MTGHDDTPAGPPVEQLSPSVLDDLAADCARSAFLVFASKQWKWRDIGVPDRAVIAAQLRGRLEQLKTGTSSRCGRLIVERYRDETNPDIETWTVHLELGHLIVSEREGIQR